jgi:hypothetical protein
VTTTAYGFDRPTVTDASTTMRNVHRSDYAERWSEVVAESGTTGRTDADLPNLISAMESADPATRLAGRALNLRLRVHAHLAECQRLMAPHTIA